MSMASDMVRKNFGEGDTIRDQGLGTPDDIVRADDICYGKDQKWQMMDIYRPRNTAHEKLPVIVSVHGGGWVYGDKNRYQFYCMNLAQRGFAVVNFTYRLAPEHKYPAPLEDTNLVFAWVLQNAEEYGFDTRYIFAVGDSAGANILALYSAVCTNPDYTKCFQFQSPEGFVPKAIALNCGLYHAEAEKNQDNLMQELILDYLPLHCFEEEMEQIDVLRHITKAFPPVFFMTCSGDFLKSQAPLLAQCLERCGVPFLYRYYVSSEEELGHVFHCNIRSGAAKLCNDEECHFFRSFIQNAGMKINEKGEKDYDTEILHRSGGRRI